MQGAFATTYIIINDIFLTCNRSDNLPHQLMDDQDDISVSGHSIGIVENPLFADNDGLEEMPSYAALSAKEKAAEVSYVALLYKHISGYTHSLF